jgi:hypothetical protein
MSTVSRAARHAVPIALVLLGLSHDASAQSLPARLGTPARETIERLADSVRAAGVPWEPLYDKAAEGVLKGADDARIVTAVRGLARDLGEARAALGPNAPPNDVVSAASAARAGIPLSALQRLRVRHRSGAVALSYIVLADLAARGVPPAIAVSSVDALLANGAGTVELTAFRSGVERDLEAGRDAGAATSARAQSVLRQLPTGSRRTPDVPNAVPEAP